MSKSRSFAKSSVDIDKHLKDQAEVEKSLKLRRDYEENFKKLEESFVKLVKIASPYVNNFDFNKAVNDDGENLAQAYPAAVKNLAKQATSIEGSKDMQILRELEADPLRLSEVLNHYNGYGNVAELR